MKQNKKRIRCQNFSLQEEDILVSLVEQYVDVVESKKIDGKTSRKKTETWDKIQDSFCAHTDTYRTAKMLREKYENMKKKAKLFMATQKSDDNEVSSCSCSEERTSTIQRLVSILAEAAAPKENSLEGDNKDKLKAQEASSETEIETELVNIIPEVQILTHENWSAPATKTKKSFRLKAKQRKILNYEETTLRAAKAKLKFFENEELRAMERHEWERELSEKRCKWEEEINKKKLELLNMQLEKEKLQANNLSATLTVL